MRLSKSIRTHFGLFIERPSSIKESAEIEIGARRNDEPPILSTFHGESNGNGPISDLAILNNV